MVHLFTGSIIYDFLEKKSVGGQDDKYNSNYQKKM